MKRLSFRLFGDRWSCLFVRRSELTDYRNRDSDGEPERADGDCIVPIRPEDHGKIPAAFRRIRIVKDMSDENMLETTIHECIHGAFPWLIEEWVAALARDIAALLIRLGFQRKHDG